MQGDRGLALLADADQWARCSHQDTTLPADGGVELAWRPLPAAVPEPGPRPCGPAGLAFDRWCRAYRSRPDRGRVQAIPGGPAEAPGALREPRGLAVDRAGRLYVVETGQALVHVVDLLGQRLLRRVPVRSPRRRRCRPVDVAAVAAGAVVLCESPAVLLRIEGRRGPLPGPALRRPRGAGARPLRVAARGEQVLVLWAGRSGGPAVVADPDGRVVATVPGASDLELAADGTLVLATAPGHDLRRFRSTAGAGAAGPGWVELAPLVAPGLDGGALASAPDGRLAFTTSSGYGWTAGVRAAYPTAGLVVGYRLDAGAYRTRWGRVFVDACLPPGTAVRVHALTSDDDDVPGPVAWHPADGAGPVRMPELTPPLPAAAALADLHRRVDADPAAGRLFRRPSGPERAWEPPGPDSLVTYETPVMAPPGRYLWLVLELTGTGRATPRVRQVRVERPGHRLATALPRAWSAQEPDAAFLQRLLAPAEGLLHELDERAALRALLLDPGIAPEDLLPWLAGLLGLVLDARWPEPARRSLLRQAYDLYRIRGTQAGLERLLGLYLPVPFAVVESWRLRGLAGAVLGAPAAPAPPPAPAVGGPGAAGALGRFAVGGVRPGEDGYTVTAHRFIVLVCGDLSDEQRNVVQGLLEHHKPAHTLVELCELGLGMRVGRRLHLGLSSVVGPGAGWGETVVGQVLVGADGVLGLPSAGSRVGSAPARAVRVG
jgi:phage tail-like protein